MATYKSGGRVKDVDREGRTIVALVSAFGNKDADGDVIVRGAYQETVKRLGPEGRDRVWHLLDHNPTKRINKPTAIRETEEGLLFETPVPETRLGDDVLALYDAVGESMEHSVHIEVLDSEPADPMDDANETTMLTRLKLWEGSTVTWGANDQARLQRMKSDGELAESTLLQDHAERLRALLNSDIQEGLKHTLEVELHLLERELKRLNELVSEQKSARNADSDRGQDREQHIARRLQKRLTIDSLTNRIDTI